MSINDIITVICWLLALGGTFFILVGAIGMLRAPDVYTRIHAASITDTGGASLIIFALCLYAAFITQEPMVVIKLLLTYFFIMFTGPTASHAVAKTALMNELDPIDKQGKPVIHQDLLRSKQLKTARENHLADPEKKA